MKASSLLLKTAWLAVDIQLYSSRNELFSHMVFLTPCSLIITKSETLSNYFSNMVITIQFHGLFSSREETMLNGWGKRTIDYIQAHIFIKAFQPECSLFDKTLSHSTTTSHRVKMYQFIPCMPIFYSMYSHSKLIYYLMHCWLASGQK